MRIKSKPTLRILFQDIAAGGFRSAVIVREQTAKGSAEKDQLVKMAMTRPPAEVRQLTTIREGVQYRNFVWGATRFEDDVWFGDGKRGDADEPA